MGKRNTKKRKRNQKTAVRSQGSKLLRAGSPERSLWFRFAMIMVNNFSEIVHVIFSPNNSYSGIWFTIPRGTIHLSPPRAEGSLPLDPTN